MKKTKTRESSGNKPGLRRVRKTLSPTLRRRVLERAGHCCQAPGCGSELFTVVHHLDPVALGGTDDEPWLVTLCWNCHDQVHEGRITLKGQAPGSLVWGEGRGGGDS